MNNEDFTMELVRHVHGGITNVRITKGKALYKLPWYRQILMRVMGRTHWVHIRFPEGEQND